MPYYSVKRKDSDVTQSLPRMSYDELQKFLSDNPEYEQVIDRPGFVKVN